MEEMSEVLSDAKHGGVFQLQREPYEVERAAKAVGLAVFRMDIGHAHDKKDFLNHIAKGLSFPSYFGGNWDALNDCLTDLAWIGDRGVVLIFEKSKHFGVGHKNDFDAAVSVLSSVAEYWRGQGRPFWAFIHGAQGWDSGLPNFPAQGAPRSA